MAIWQDGDLVLTLSGPTGTYNNQSIAAWGQDGTYRGIIDISPPLPPTPPFPDGIPPVQIVIQNGLLYGFQNASAGDYFATADGTANNLVNDRVANLATGQCFDAAGNRYISDFDSTSSPTTFITQIAPDGTERRLYYNLGSDPNAFDGDPNRLQVDRAGIYLFWNQCADAPYHENTDIGATKMEIATGNLVTPVDILATANSIMGAGVKRLVDFVVSSADEIYFCVGASAANEHIIITDLFGNLLRTFPVSFSFEVGAIAVSPDNSIIAVLRDITLGFIIEIFDTTTGVLLRTIDFVNDSGMEGIWGMTFAVPAVVSGVFFMNVTVIGAN